jgi:hypothetical protein
VIYIKRILTLCRKSLLGDIDNVKPAKHAKPANSAPQPKAFSPTLKLPIE